MDLKCPICHKLEEVVLRPNNIIRFACGYERVQTKGDLNELFRNYGGER